MKCWKERGALKSKTAFPLYIYYYARARARDIWMSGILKGEAVVDCIVKVILPVTSGSFMRDQVPALFKVKTVLMAMTVSSPDAPVVGQTMKIVGRVFGPVAKVKFTKGGGSCIAVLRADQFMNREADFSTRLVEYEQLGFEQEAPVVEQTYRLVESGGGFDIEAAVK
jgi:hypothetical protein